MVASWVQLKGVSSLELWSMSLCRPANSLVARQSVAPFICHSSSFNLSVRCRQCVRTQGKQSSCLCLFMFNIWDPASHVPCAINRQFHVRTKDPTKFLAKDLALYSLPFKRLFMHNKCPISFAFFYFFLVSFFFSFSFFSMPHKHFICNKIHCKYKRLDLAASALASFFSSEQNSSTSSSNNNNSSKCYSRQWVSGLCGEVCSLWKLRSTFGWNYVAKCVCVCVCAV